MLRKVIVALILLLAPLSVEARFPRGGGGGSVTPSTGGVLLNLNALTYFNGYGPFLNWWKTGSSNTIVSSINGTLSGKAAWDNGTYFDTTTGELKNPLPADFRSLSRAFFTPVLWPQYQYEGTAFNNFAGQVWNVTWTGCSTSAMTVTTTGSLGTGAPAPSFSGNSGTITFGSAAIANVGLLFTPTVAGACYTNPPRNIVVSQSQYAANVAAGQVFNPDYIAAIKPFGILRLMDWMHINYSGISASTQLADLNYTYAGQDLNMAYDFAGSISGTTLTVGLPAGAPWEVGQTVVASGLTVVTTITGLGSGTGGAGTYTISCAGGCPTLSARTMMGVPSAGINGDYGPKAGVAPDVACALANATGSIIEYPIPIAATNQYVTDIATALKACMPAGVKVKYSLANEIWNPTFYQFYYNQAQIANGISDWQGYRAAQLMDIVYNVYGAGQRNRWLGAMGSQTVNPGYTTSNLTGAAAAISGLGLHTMTQLFDTVDVAPYFGDFFPGSFVSNVTVGAAPTVTINTAQATFTGVITSGTLTVSGLTGYCCYVGQAIQGAGVNAATVITGGSGSVWTVNPSQTVGSTAMTSWAPHGFTNGQTIAMFVSGGTMGTVLDSNAVVGTNVYATVSNPTASGFDINISTVGKTFGGSSNYVMPATLPKMADRSIALNGSTPATYPTKFSFFAQQMAKAILNGSATDASYGTLTIPAATNLSGGAGSIQDSFSQQITALGASGLKLGQYENGYSSSLAGYAANPVAQQAMEFLNQSQFDNGVTGDTTNTPANLYVVAFAAYRGLGLSYPAQFNELQPQTQFGPWGALRFIGDSNPRWQAILNENALGP